MDICGSRASVPLIIKSLSNTHSHSTSLLVLISPQVFSQLKGRDVKQVIARLAEKDESDEDLGFGLFD